MRNGRNYKAENYASHGDGSFTLSSFKKVGKNVIFEKGVFIFHPENIEIGDNVYVGHYAILKGYHKNTMVIGDGTWIGQFAFLHSGGGIVIGKDVGIGPAVQIITSVHDLAKGHPAIMRNPIKFAPVSIGDGSDIGAGAILLPGVRIGRYVQIGAGSVVSSDVKDSSIVAGVPAKLIRMRR